MSGVEWQAIHGCIKIPKVEWCAERGVRCSEHVEGREVEVHQLQMPYFVYILRRADDTFYVGHAENLQARLKEHNGGHGAQYTAFRRPVRLVYSEELDSLKAAVFRERQLKRWSRAKKEALMSGEPDRLKQLSKRRS